MSNGDVLIQMTSSFKSLGFIGVDAGVRVRGAVIIWPGGFTWRPVVHREPLKQIAMR